MTEIVERRFREREVAALERIAEATEAIGPMWQQLMSQVERMATMLESDPLRNLEAIMQATEAPPANETPEEGQTPAAMSDDEAAAYLRDHPGITDVEAAADIILRDLNDGSAVQFSAPTRQQAKAARAADLVSDDDYTMTEADRWRLT